jgi:hypothetical protein
MEGGGFVGAGRKLGQHGGYAAAPADLIGQLADIQLVAPVQIPKRLRRRFWTIDFGLSHISDNYPL